MLSNFIPEESGAIGISIVHLHNSRSDKENAHVATSNHDRPPLLLPVYQDVLDYRTPSLPDDARAKERGTRGAGDARTRFANSQLIEKLVRHKNREITAAGKMREKSPDDYSLTV